MAISLPPLRSSSQQVLYGSTRIVSCMTTVTPFNNASEQRWPERPPLYGFILPMHTISDEDRAAWLSFFSDPEVLGQFGQTAELTVRGVTYSDLSVQSDTLSAVARRASLFDIEVRLRQVKAANVLTYSPPSVGGTYPNLKFGRSTTTAYNSQYPFTQMSRYRTQSSDAPTGQQFNYPWYANGLSGFPTSHLRSWTLEYEHLTDTDMDTLETYFLGKRGRYTTFDFVDPLDSLVTYHNVRFASDELAIRYVGYNHNSTTIRLIQTNG